MHFCIGHLLFVKVSALLKAAGQFSHLSAFLSLSLYHLRVPAIVGNFLITVFAIDFPVRIHVYVQISTPLTYLFAQLTNQLTFIMIWLNVQPQILVSRIFKVAYDTGRHCQCQVKPECSIKYGNISVPK